MTRMRNWPGASRTNTGRVMNAITRIIDGFALFLIVIGVIFANNAMENMARYLGWIAP